MKYQSPQELTATATTYTLPPQPRMSRRQRIERWAELLDQHEGALNALRRVEYLSPDERRAYRGANTPLTVAFSDPMLREEGLKSDRLGDTMDFFDMSDHDAHLLLCDCRYHGSMTGPVVARRLRQHADRKERRARVMRGISRFFGFA
ncbi:hypothetical protein [Chelativorans sp. AA-79]|uniref:hypothetical protein n=1 Tax=Chelativorans sp. AA-79 TaxID=3028735 RepID=UPI0023F865B3|nr:hypothetical protein [Chelativorans sp. AA-79]WEX07645.1 hypothetical protein PVE73_16205 [Chelativorans sp. AA-79]